LNVGGFWRSEGAPHSICEEREKIWLEGGTPVFFVSVAAKEVTDATTLLFATLAGDS
jgi:hypothetical protein